MPEAFPRRAVPVLMFDEYKGRNAVEEKVQALQSPNQLQKPSHNLTPLHRSFIIPDCSDA